MGRASRTSRISQTKRQKLSADSSQEDTAPENKNVGLTILKSATHSDNMEAHQIVPKGATVNAKHFIPMPAGTRSRTKPAHGKTADSSI
jgi:hypothetical protein